MANVFVEARPKGRPEGSAIEGYVVEDHIDNVLGSFNTQGEAITWAKGHNHSPVVARVRHLNEKKEAGSVAIRLRRRLRSDSSSPDITKE